MVNEVQLDGIGLTQMIRPVPPFDTSTPPSNGQALIWDAAAGKYKPGPGGGGLVNIQSFGATGTSDDSAVFAAAYAAVPDYGALLFPAGTYTFPAGITHTRPLVSLVGPGRIVGKLTVGIAGVDTDFQGSTISGLRFSRGVSSTDPTVSCITVLNATNLLIEDCYFRDAGSAVYAPLEGNTARSGLTRCRYYNIGYLLRAPNLVAATWRAIADIHVQDCEGQANVGHVVLDSIDGLVCTGNTFFMPGSASVSTVKATNITVGFSDWIHIADNNLFESGTEAIALTDPNHFDISDNNIAWPGQRVASDAISITLVTRTFTFGHIGGGTISQATKNVIGFYGTGTYDISHVKIAPISIERTSGTPTTYYGVPALGTPYRVYVDNALATNMPTLPPYSGDLGTLLPDNYHGRLITAERWITARAKESSLVSRSSTITGATSIYQLTDINRASSFLGGRIDIDIRNDGTTAKSAFYSLVVCLSPDGTLGCTVAGSAGRTAGAAANDPSFTWALVNTAGSIFLQATPVGSTSGAFNHTAISTGNLLLA